MTLLSDPHLILVGSFDGTHIGGSLLRAARKANIAATAIPISTAQSRFPQVNSAAWRLLERRSPYSSRLRERVVNAIRDHGPATIVTTGLTPIDRGMLAWCRNQGCTLLHYSTDDPWNPGQVASWHFAALREYDVVFTPRKANIADLKGLPCREVVYLPFAYDSDLFSSQPTDAFGGVAPTVLFVGGADPDRAAFFERYLSSGTPVMLAGAYWSRFKGLRPHSIGTQTPTQLAALTRAAAVNLCLVRRANRDGHVMRSFEIAALGGCMLAEDTVEHRDLFGADGECAVYFSSPEHAAHRVRELLADIARRKALASSLRQRVQSGHTYGDRLRSMLSALPNRQLQRATV